MAELFTSTPGTVAVLGESNAVPGRIRIADPAFPEGNIAVLVSGADYNQQTNQQFQASLEDAVYIYVFGDRMGDCIVRGVVFAASCQEGGKSGIQELLNFYKENRASKRSTPIQVQVAEDQVRGFLTGITIRNNVLSTDSIAAMYDYTLVISALPQG